MSSIKEISEIGKDETDIFDQAIDYIKKIKYKRSSTIVKKRKTST